MLQQSIFREYHALMKYGLRLFDLCIIVLAAVVSYWVKFGHIALSEPYQHALWVAAACAMVGFHPFKLYVPIRGRGLFSYLMTLTWALGAAVVMFASASFLTKSAVILSREWFLVWAGISWCALTVSRCFLWWLAGIFRARGWNPRRIVIIGTNDLAVKLVQEMQKTLGNGFKAVAFITDEAVIDHPCLLGVPVRSMPTRVNRWLKLNRINEVWIALPLGEEQRIKQLIHYFRDVYVTVRYVFDIFGLSLHKHAVTEIAGFPVIDVLSTPLIGGNRIVKVVEDIVLATLILILISPLLAVIAAIIKLTSPGPVIFKQRRHGANGQEIKVYKFRSMYQHAEAEGTVTQARRDDGRVTPFGQFLRRTSLDELPQFINVLQGRMSIVGPRPHAVEHNAHYRKLIESYMQRHRVKPGITGWAQVNGYRGETDTLDKMKKRVEYDIYYIDNWCLSLDLRIIALTLLKGFVHRNAR